MELQPADLPSKHEGIPLPALQSVGVEESLQANEDRYRIISELIFDYAFSWRVEPDGEIVFEWITDSFTRVTGFTWDEVSAAGTYALYHSEDVSRVKADLQKIRNGEATSGEYRIITKSGEVRWLQIDRRPVWDAQQKRVIRFYGVAQDITERKLTENALRQSEERFRLVAQAATDALYDWDIETNAVWRSEGYQRMLGLDGPPGADLDWLMARVHAEDRDAVESGLHALIESDQNVWTLEYRLRHNNGTYANFTDRGFIVRDENGRARRMVGVLTDVTERKVAETALRKSEAQFRTLFTYAAIGIALVDPAGRVVETNPALQKMLGYSNQELCQMRFNDFTFPEDIIVEQPLLQQLLAGNIDHYEMEKRFIRKDGQIIWVHLTASLMPASDAPYQLGIGMVEDITLRKTAEHTLHRRDALLEVLTHIGEDFLRADNLENVIPAALARLGQAIDSSRVQLYQNHKDVNGNLLTSLKYEWDAPGIRSLINTPERQSLRYVDFEGVQEILLANRCFYGLTRDFRPSLRTLLEAADTLSGVLVPIFCGNEFWGMLGYADCKTEREWHPIEIEVLRNAAGTFGVALLRHQIEAAEREQRLLAEALRDTASVLTSTLDPDVVMARILSNVGTVVRHDAVNIMLIEGDTARPVYSSGYKDHKIVAPSMYYRDIPNLRRMIETGKPVFTADTTQDKSWYFTGETPWLRSYAGAPLRVHGVVIGFLNLDSATPNFFNEQRAERLQAFADQAAIAIENAQLYDELRHRASELEHHVAERTHDLQVATEVSKQITTTLEFDELLPSLVNQMIREFGLYDVAVFRLTETQQILPYKTSPQNLPQIAGAGLRPTISWGVLHATQTRQPVLINDVLEESNYSPDPQFPDTRAELALPMLRGDQVLGVLDLRSTQPKRFTPDAVRILTNLAEQISIAIGNSQLFAEVTNARRESDILYRVSRAVNATTSYPAIIQALLDEIGPVDYAIILGVFEDHNLVGASYTEIVAFANAGNTEVISMNQRFPLYIVPSDENGIAIIEDMNDPAQVDEAGRVYFKSVDIQAMLGANVALGERTIGNINFLSDKPRKFTAFERRLIRGMADLAAAALERTRLLRQAEADRSIAEDANRVKSQFLANMSHELRTPLNAILNFTAFVADGVFGPVNDEQMEALKQAVSSGKHLLSLINDILDLTKIEVGLMDLFIQEVDVNEALAASVSVAKGLINNKPLVLDTTIEQDLPHLFGDKRRIRQIFLNLVSNAVKFTPQGSIGIAAYQEGHTIHVVVRDTGIGIAPEHQSLIFESFKQVESDVSEAVGTGLGLPISKFFAEAHGGKLWIESEIGKGSTFHVILPIRKAEEANMANAQTAAKR